MLFLGFKSRFVLSISQGPERRMKDKMRFMLVTSIICVRNSWLYMLNFIAQWIFYLQADTRKVWVPILRGEYLQVCKIKIVIFKISFRYWSRTLDCQGKLTLILCVRG